MRNEKNENLRTEREKIEFEYIYNHLIHNTIIKLIEAREIIVIS